MNEASASFAAAAADLRVGEILRDTWTIYRRLFLRSIGAGLLVLVPLHVLASVLRGPVAALLFVLLSLVGAAVVQAVLIELIQDEHVGVPVRPLGTLYGSAAGRLPGILSLSVRIGLIVGLGCLALVVPGLILMGRYSLAIPAYVLERRSQRESLKRSRTLVKGHTGGMLWLLVSVGLLSGAFQFLLGLAVGLLVAGTPSQLVLFLTGVVAATLTTPYTAHALSVAYYRLAEPERPVLSDEPRESWRSVWQAQDAEESWEETRRRLEAGREYL